MIKVGITGGIGSGKTLACHVFSALGIPIYYADTAAKILTETDSDIRQSLIRLFGEKIYDGNRVNRTMLKGLIFNNEDLLSQVNQIIHPKVAADFIGWCNKYVTCNYIMHEAAILFESNAYKLFDRIITVIAPENVRTERILHREGMTQKLAKSIINNQLSDDEKVKLSDYVIVNDNKTLVIPQILKIHSELIN
jgi:dephospho-CoA kinase